MKWGGKMSDLSVNFCGLRSPNPFWLASGPPTNTGGQVMRAFDAGWGGAGWETIRDPIQKPSPRYGAKPPVISKLTPNVTDITHIALAAERGGADAVSLINTINSLMGVDLETFAPRPNVAGKSSHGGYCGPAVKPLALHLLSSVAKKV